MLSVRGVTKSYGEVTALRGVDVDVDAGSIVALLGRNGAGKSTLLSVVAGLIQPDAGAVLVGGVDALAEPDAAAALLGIAPQETGVYRVLTVTENLGFFGELAGLRGAERRQRTDIVMAELGLSDLAERRADRLSGGELRRLHTACALMHRPPLLMLDEPTVGAEQVVPGQVVLFGFFVASSVAFSVFREHGWRTWDRLRASAAPPWAILAGFAVPWIVIHVLYQVLLMIIGGAILGLRLNGGSPIAVLLVVVGYATVAIAIVMLIASTLRTANQVNGITNLGAMVLGGLGGALAPIDQLPGWARAVAPLTPTYWAMEGHRDVFLRAGGVTDVLPDVAILLAAAMVIGAVTSLRFRVDETKEFFA